MAGPAAVIVRLLEVRDHSNADRLDVVTFQAPFPDKASGAGFVQVVTGKHYQSGSRGEAVWFRPGSFLPGWLAEELWHSHRAAFEVKAFPVRGEMSSGMVAGKYWRISPEHPFELWPYWKSSWHPGVDVSDYLGVWFRPHSSVAEHPADNREVAAAYTSVERKLVGAEPAAGSN